MNRRIIRLTIAAAGLLLATTACGLASGESISVQGYHAPFDAVTDATDFAGTPLVVLATAVSAGEVRWNGPGGERPTDTSKPAFLWTPVDVKVDRVLRGGELLDGDELTVRILGGTKDGVTVDFSEFEPPAVPDAGTQMLLFLNPPVDAGDGVLAATPNHAYIVAGGVATASNGSHEVALAELVSLVAAGPVTGTTPANPGVATTSTTLGR